MSPHGRGSPVWEKCSPLPQGEGSVAGGTCAFGRHEAQLCERLGARHEKPHHPGARSVSRGAKLRSCVAAWAAREDVTGLESSAAAQSSCGAPPLTAFRQVKIGRLPPISKLNLPVDRPRRRGSSHLLYTVDRSIDEDRRSSRCIAPSFNRSIRQSVSNSSMWSQTRRLRSGGNEVSQWWR